jgi:hypothetical protein
VKSVDPLPLPEPSRALAASVSVVVSLSLIVAVVNGLRAHGWRRSHRSIVRMIVSSASTMLSLLTLIVAVPVIWLREW